MLRLLSFQWSFYWENLNFYTKNFWYGQKTPYPSWKCQNFPLMYYSHSSLFHWLRIKGNDLVRKRVYLPTPNPGSYCNLIYFTNVLSPLQMLWKENDSMPRSYISFSSTLQDLMILLLKVFQEIAFLDLWFLPSEKQLQTNALMLMFKRRNQFSNQALRSSLQSWFIPSIRLKF